MKKICLTRGHAPYEAPLAEMIDVSIETGMLYVSGDYGKKGKAGIDLDELDGYDI